MIDIVDLSELQLLIRVNYKVTELTMIFVRIPSSAKMEFGWSVGVGIIDNRSSWISWLCTFLFLIKKINYISVFGQVRLAETLQHSNPIYFVFIPNRSENWINPTKQCHSLCPFQWSAHPSHHLMKNTSIYLLITGIISNTKI